MPEEQGTINNADSSSQSAPLVLGDLISTVEFATPPSTADTSKADDNSQQTPHADDDNNKDTKDAAGEEAKAKADAGEKESSDDGNVRFDKHPRFVELNTRMKEAETKAALAEEKLRELETKLDGGEGKEGKDLPYKDVSQMTAEEIQEWQEEDPKGFYANMLQQAKHEIANEQRQEMSKQSKESAIAGTFEKYAKDNPDFDEMWDSGELKRFMEKNPGHNAISAHMALTGQKKQQEAIDAAVKESEKRIMANIKAKGNAKVLGQGPSSARPSNDSSPPDLKDTKQYGGLTAVLARRSMERDRARGLG